MARIFYILSCLAFWSIPVYSQNTNISGVINHYVKVNQLGGGNCIDSLYVTSTAGFSVDDTVLLIQMKGATIDVSNTSNFGSVLNHGNSGNYEFSTVKSVSTGSLVLNTKLLNSYTATGSLQLVRVPSYTNVTVTGTLTAAPWNGQIGGVLALFANGSLALNGDIDASEKGFRGGSAPGGSFNCNQTAYFYPTGSPNGGSKGEGIAALVQDVKLGGAQANGGGGGNNNNSGGGGGGNFSQGGRGGNQVLYAACTGMAIGGEGGSAQTIVSSLDKIYLGGGGGSGHQNDNTNSGIHGKNGGGIIFISAQTLIGNNSSIKSNGTSNLQMPFTDGAGGGGAAGTIIFDIANFSGNVNVELKGGNGGSINSALYCLGTGGGGSGGVLIHTGSTVPANVIVDLSGGLTGTQINSGSTCYQSAWGGTNGQDGATFSNFNLDLPFEFSANAGIDKVICSGDSIQLGSLPQPGLSYLWSNGAGTQSNPFVSPTTTTSYVLSVSSAGVCPSSDTDTVQVTVHPSPQASFTYSFDCSGLSVAFNNTSTLISNANWNFGDGVSISTMSPTHTYPDTGNYNVQLIVSTVFGCVDTFIALPGTYTISLIALNSCGSDTFEVEITINPNSIPIAAFSLDTTWCSNIVSFYDSSLNTTGWFWDFGDGSSSSSQSPFHTYADSGSYDITLIASNSCGADTLTSQLNLMNFEMPNASFTYVEQLCDPSVSFMNLSEFYDSISWYLGDGTTSFDTSFIHLYQDAGSYNVLLVAENECGIDSLIQVLEINAIQQPEANFYFSLNECTKLVNFFDLSLNDFSWSWYFGDGGTSFEQNPIYEYQQSGFYEVMLIVNEGTICADTVQRTLIIDENSIAGLFIPNVFTPNNDGLNDLFELKYTELCEEISIKIFNRWGQQVFQSDNKQFKWDGKHNGVNVPEGVYYFILYSRIDKLIGTVSVFR
ncbi:MAG: PKD domain-containing protein [Bacteroidetes bacterium]|nr:PKD domain-containing protein [Bacteroidota bacterium]